MTTAQRLMKWASEIHLARAEVQRLHAERSAIQCEREQAYEAWLREDEANSGRPPPGQYQPCWKWVSDDEGSGHAGELSTTGEWCESCIRRHDIHKRYRHAMARLGSLKGALWRLAAKAHAEVEAKLDALPSD